MGSKNKTGKDKRLFLFMAKGEGVAQRIRKTVENTAINYYFQDASFREYGFGATMVTIK